jgi:transcription initiation factor TFIIIB Brf1 subunit/transcription initiation factor TFIIB
MTGEEWAKRFAAELGLEEPTPEEIDEILRLAAVAAHSSERTAAPVASWLAGKTGRPVAELIEIAERIEPS